MSEAKALLMGCGILQREVDYLIRKNNWPLETLYFDSALHVDFNKLDRCLTSSLAEHDKDDVIVFYGTCHPLIDDITMKAHACRTRGQNCVEMLLGVDVFTEELSNGAYFLLEDWARRWKSIMMQTFGTQNMKVIKEIFRGDRTYLLGLRTCCSGDFTVEAESAARMMDMPLKWRDVDLDHLESVLAEAVDRSRGIRNVRNG